MKRILILFILLICFWKLSFSQSEFILRGKSGLGAGLGLNINRTANGLDLFAGYSYRGFLDVKLTYLKANGGIAKNGIVSPIATFYPAKQEDAEGVPTIGISLGYSFYSYTETRFIPVPGSVVSQPIIITQIEEKKNAVILGVTAYRRIGYWNVFFFQPMLGAGLAITNSGLEFKLQGGVAVGARIVNGPLLILTPSIEVQSELTTFVLSIGVVL